MRSELEYSLVGALCIEPNLITKLQRILSVEDFSINACACVFECVASAVFRGKAIDENIVADSLNGIVDKPREFLAKCVEITPSTANACEWARMLHESARNERFHRDVLAALDGENPAVHIADICKTHLLDSTDKRLKSASSAVQAAIHSLTKKEPSRIDFRFPLLDGLLKGCEAGQLVLVGARPSVGKSAFILNIAENVARQGKAVLFVTLEMLADEQVERMIARRSGVELDKLVDRRLSAEDWEKISTASSEISQLPIQFYDKPACSPRKILEAAATVEDLKLIIVDYVGLMSSDKEFNGNRNLELGAISRDLKNMAQDLRIPIIAAAQLNRLQDDAERPTLASLRDSGELEQNGSKVLFLWNIDKDAEIVGCSVAKNRRGRCGVVQMVFDGAHQRFSELDAPYIDPPKKRRGFITD